MRCFVVGLALALTMISRPARADDGGDDGGDDASIEDAAADVVESPDASTDAGPYDAAMDACTTPCTCVPCTTRPDAGDDEVNGEPAAAVSSGCSCDTEGASSPFASSAWLVAVVAIVLRTRTRRRGVVIATGSSDA